MESAVYPYAIHYTGPTRAFLPETFGRKARYHVNNVLQANQPCFPSAVLSRIESIMPVCHRKHLSKLGSASYIKPYLLRGLDIDHRNQVWCIDITYIPMKKGFMYLTAIIDIYSRFIVGWSLYNSLDASHCIEVLQSAIATYGSPEIINSDLDFIQSQAGKQAIIDTHVEGIIVKNLNIA